MILLRFDGLSYIPQPCDVSGTASQLVCAVLVGETCARDAELGCATWWTRVPTGGNPADAASRLRFTELRHAFPGVQIVNAYSRGPEDPEWEHLFRHLYGALPASLTS